MDESEKISHLEKEIEELKKRLESLEKGQSIDDVEMTRMILKTISSNTPNS